MASIDIFANNAFSMASLSNAMDLAPYVPQMLGTMGIFKEKRVRTLDIWVEQRRGKLAIISTAARGTMKDVRSSTPRNARAFRVPHVPYFQNILADDIQGLRAFGSETELETVGSYINEQLAGMRQDHEVTHEFHRINALKGIVYDADNTTVIYNFLTEFGVTQEEIDWATTDASFVPTATSIIRTIAGKLGNDQFRMIVALCGDQYFDAVTRHASTLAAYDRWRDGEFLRQSYLGPEWYAMAANGFMFQNIMFVNYRGQIDDVPFIADDEAYYFPLGVVDMFEEVQAPADFMETVNTLGRRFYAKQEPMRYNKGVELHTQSNVLMLNKRPDAVVKSTLTDAT